MPNSPSKYFVSQFEAEPVKADSPKVFFYTRLWDPSIASCRSSQNVDLDGGSVEDRIAQKNKEYQELSDLRASLVKSLKIEFGKRFVGGLAPSAYVMANYPDLVGSDISRRADYTRAMHSAEICVNTQGTHGCYNFSFGEALASSRAIITEQPMYKVPPFLEIGKNFDTYYSVDDCLEKVTRLFEDGDMLYEMMLANRDYYMNHLRPDKYVLDCLSIAGMGL